MPDLIPDEIETLRMLAGQLPRKQRLCALELAAMGLCAPDEPHRLTARGISVLDVITGTVDLQSRGQA